MLNSYILDSGSDNLQSFEKWEKSWFIQMKMVTLYT